MAVSEEGHAWPPPQGKWTYEDYLRLPDDGWQYEIIRGVLYMVPAPTPRHQIAVGSLGVAMSLFTRERQAGIVFFAPTDVYLPGQDTPVQPDLLFVAAGREGIIGERGVEGAPDLVVEVLSPRSWWKDRRVKMPLYEKTGVAECWIVDLEMGTIEVYVLDRGGYRLLGQWGRGEKAHSQVLEGFRVRVDEIVGKAQGRS